MDIYNDVTKIGDCAFADCTILQTINLPNSVTEIGDYTFENFTSLQYINIPDNVTDIGNFAFKNCTSLSSINIPKNIQHIGVRAFANCKNLIKKVKYKACDIIRDGDRITYSCRGTEYAIGEQMPVINNIECYERGYAYVENFYDIFNYHCGDLNNIALFEVETGNEVITDEDGDSLCVTNTMKLVKHIPWNEAFN